MKLNLTKDIVFFDVESSGLSISTDRIISIAIIKVFADGRPNFEKLRLINPTIPISEESTKIHGITNGMVQNEPTFKDLHKGILTLIGDSDIGGYNSNRFDLPLLVEEFSRCGINFDTSNRRFVDVMRNFHILEKRTLSGAYKFYCNKKLEGAHDAMNDIKATLEILEAQLDFYKDVEYENEKTGEIIKSPIKNDIQSLHDFVNDPNELTFDGKIVLNTEGVPSFSFGKYQSSPVGESLAKDSSYHRWISNGDFTTETKRLVDKLVNEFKEKNNA